MEGVSDRAVENMLRDESKNNQLFTHSILQDRHLSVKRSEMTIKMTGRHRRPSFEVKPQHYHLNEPYRDEKEFKRRRFSAIQAQNRLVESALKLERNEIREKEEDSKAVMRNLLRHYLECSSSGSSQQVELVIRTTNRLFLKYCNKQA